MESKNKLSHQLLMTIPVAMSFLSQTIKDCALEGLGVTQFRILSNIDNGINRVKDIAEINGVSQPAISKMVELMVNKDLLHRQKDGEDRRSSVLALTLKGREIYRGVEMMAADKVLERLSNIDDNEVAEIEQALTKIEALVYPKM